VKGRPLGLPSLLALGVNGIVGVGIFYVPADLARGAPGLGSVLVFAVAGLALLPVALVFATLARRFDVDGGPVVYAHAAFGERPAFVVGWIAYLSALASTAAVTAGLATSLAPALGLAGFGSRLVAVVLVTLLALLCAAGIVISARAWTTLTVLKLLPLMALVAVSLLLPAPTPSVSATTWVGSLSLGAALRVVFTYQGFEIVPVLAGQAHAPERSVPWATVGSLTLAGLLYVAVQRTCVLALPDLAHSLAPLADAASAYGGPRLGELVGVGTSLSALGIALGMMVATPRYLSALAEECALGLGLERSSERGAPLRALLVTWAFVAVLVLWDTLGQLFDLASVAVLAQYVATAAALLALAVRGERGLAARHAWLALPAIVVGTALAAGASAREWAAGGMVLALGLLLRALRRR
jgi:amino acid transporter